MTSEHINILLKKLPLRNSAAAVVFPSSFEQCVDYPEQPSPIKATRKVSFACIDNTTALPLPLYTPFLWKQVIRHYNIPFNYEHCFIQKLKSFIMNPTMMSLLGGRRAYPVLELLDQPKVQVEKRHLQGFGYFISFLLNSKVDVDGEVFNWSGLCGEEILSFVMYKK